MDRLLTTVAVLDRDARLRRDAAAWRHLHPTTEAPSRLPLDLDVVPTWRRVVARMTDPAAGRRDRSSRRAHPIAVAASSR